LAYDQTFHPNIKAEMNIPKNLNAEYSTKKMAANFTNLKFEKPANMRLSTGGTENSALA
jgi:hypothetical protein